MSIILDIKVIPGASRERVTLDTVCDIRCYVTAQPEDNKANYALIALLADILDIPKQGITIVAGHTARHKRLEIQGFVDKKEVFERLRLEVQRALF